MRKGHQVDVALHEMDMGPDGLDGKIPVLQKLAVFDNVAFPIPERRCDVFVGKNFYSLPHGHKNVENYLIEKFPDEKSGIKKYFSMLYRLANGHKHQPYEMGYWEFFFFPITGFRGFILPLI